MLRRLSGIGAHRHLRHVHVAIGDRHHAQVFFASRLATSGKFRQPPAEVAFEAWPPVLEYTPVSSTRMLTSRPTGDVIQSAEANIVGPAVAADDPDARLHQRIGYGSAISRRLG